MRPWLVAQLVGASSVHQKFAGLIPSRGAYLGCGFDPWLGKRVRSTNKQLQNSHRDVKYSTGNMDDDTVITMFGARWALDLLG